MNRFGIFALLFVSAFVAGPNSFAQWSEYPQPRLIIFSNGYSVTKDPRANSPIVKFVTGPTEANIKGTFTNDTGLTFYLSDWSWDRRMSGQSHFWMLPKTTPATPKPNPGSSAEYQVMNSAQEFSFPKGFTIVAAPSSTAKRISTKPGPLTASVRAYKDTGGIRYYMSDWSYQRIREGHKPNWIRPASAMKVDTPAEPDLPPAYKFSKQDSTIVFSRGYEVIGGIGPSQKVLRREAKPSAVFTKASAFNSRFNEDQYYLDIDNFSRWKAGQPFLWIKEVHSPDRPDLVPRMAKLKGSHKLMFETARYSSIPWKLSSELYVFDRRKAVTMISEIDLKPYVTEFAFYYEDQEFPQQWMREVAKIFNQRGELPDSISTLRNRLSEYPALRELHKTHTDEMMVSYVDDWAQFDRRVVSILEAERENFAEVEKLLFPIIDEWNPSDDGLNASGPKINVLREYARAQWKQGKTDAARASTRLWLDAYARDIASELLHPEYVDASQRVIEFDSDFEVIGDYFDLLEAVTDPEIAAEIVIGLKGLKLAVTTSQQIQRANSADPVVAALSRELVQLLEQQQRDAIAGKELDGQREERISEINSELAMRRLSGTQLSLRDNPQWSKLQSEIDRRRKAGADEWDVKKLSGQRDLIALGHMIERGKFIAKSADVAAKLRADEALIDFFKLPGATFEEKGRYGAVVLLPDGSTHLVAIGETQTIDGVVKEFRDLIQITGKYSNHSDEQLEVDSVKVRARVFDLILKPLLPHLPSINKLAICADSQLHFVPFDALHSGDGNIAANQWEITYINAARDLLRPRSEQAANGGTALLIGNPNFQITNAEASSEDYVSKLFALDEKSRNLLSNVARGVSFGPLPGTREEVLKLAPKLAKAGYRVKTLTGNGATESALSRLTESPTILHFATHGFFFNELPVASKNASSADEPKSAMLLSGLALSGAQNTLDAWDKGSFPSPSSDGMLLASEVSQLDLSKTNTVVLSACETAVGKALSGEGVEGLRSGLALAGAENVVLTLWPVDDAATVEVMEVFYDKVLSGLPAPIAMAETKRELFKKFSAAEGEFNALLKIDPFIVTRSGGL